MEGKTVFAIAHRLSTLREMDRILVFKDGQIVEDGTHRKLLQNREGVYSSFWSHQAGGFIK
jgi:ABC-type multidrug transport system fused ATPase/permease subunit